MKRVLLYVEEEHYDETVGLLDVIMQLYPNQKVAIYALIINPSKDFSMTGLFDVIFTLQDKKLEYFDQRAITNIFYQLHNQYSFDAILFLATSMGRCLAPAVAMKLNTGIVADVTSISSSNNKISLIRPAYSGKIMAEIEIVGDGPIMMSVRSGIFIYEEKRKVKTSIIELKNLSYSYSKIRVKEVKEKVIPYDIRKSNVLVSGGAGCTDLEQLKSLADLLNGKVSASRAVVDKGIVSRSIQVGQSGKTVSPSLYFALGIHGALQHIEGLKNVAYIVSVNTNKDAPICSISDIVVEGDAKVFLTKLIKKINTETNCCDE